MTTVTTVVPPSRGKTIISYPFESDRASLTKARSLWGEHAFAEKQNHKLGVTCRVGIMSGTTKIIYGSAPTWEGAFAYAVSGEESHNLIRKS